MYFPFLITLQQEKTERRKNELLKRKATIQCAPVKGVKEAVTNANNACQYFKSEIKTTKNKILSYVPFTKMFSHRVICAKRLDELNTLLDQVEKNLSKGKVKKVPTPKPLKTSMTSEKMNGASPLKKSQSIYIEKTYPSPVKGAPIRKNQSAPLVGANNKANFLPILLKL